MKNSKCRSFKVYLSSEFFPSAKNTDTIYMMLIISLYMILILGIIVAVGSFQKKTFTSRPIVKITSFNSAFRELDQPLEILQERSTHSNSRELNKLATRLISRCSSHHHLRKCDEIYEFLRTVCEPDNKTQTALMSAYIRYVAILLLLYSLD